MTEKLNSAWALIGEHGMNLKLTKDNWLSNEYIYFDSESWSWLDEKKRHAGVTGLFEKEAWKLYKPEPKMITWYKPMIDWHKNETEYPTYNDDAAFFESKEHCLKLYNFSNYKVIKWMEIELPETWE